MSDTALRWATPARLLTLPLAVLAMVLMTRDTLGISASPFVVIAAFFAGILLLLVVARHPAAFIAPALFLPRLKAVGVLSSFGPARDWTSLHLACALLAVGVFLRWLGSPRHPGGAAANALPAAAAEPRSPLSRPMTAFLVFAAIVAFSFLYTAAPHYGSQKLAAFATLGCGMFFAPLLLFSGERDFRDFTIGTTLFALLVAASSLSFSATGAMGADANPAHIGKGQVIGLAILLLVYTPIENRWLRSLVLGLCIPALAVGLVSAETRGPLFSLLMVLILSLFLDSFRSPVLSRRQMVFAGAALVGAVMLLSAFWFYGQEEYRFQYKAAEIINLVEGDNQARGTAVERLVFYRAALQLWTQKPAFGWGLGGWSMAYWQNDMRQYPHNLFLEVLVEQGLIGLAALLYFLNSVFRHLRAHRAAARSRFPCLLPGLVYLISIAMFSGDLDDDRFIWFWCGLVLAGCSLAVRLAKQSAMAADTADCDPADSDAAAVGCCSAR